MSGSGGGSDGGHDPVPRGHIMGKVLDVRSDGRLYFQNGSNQEEVRVVASKTAIYVGCVKLTREAWSLVLEKIAISEANRLKKWKAKA